MFLKTPNIHLFPRVASNWVSYFSFLGRSNDKCVPPCRLFIVSDLTPQISYFLSKIWGRDCLLKIQSLRSFICLSFIFEILLFFYVGCGVCDMYVSPGVHGGTGSPRAEVTGNSDLHDTVLRTKFKTSARVVEALDSWDIPPALHIFFPLAASRKSSEHDIKCNKLTNEWN